MKKTFYAFILFSFSLLLNGQNFITVPFSNGFVGNVNNTTSANNCYYHSGTGGLGWTNIQFAQNSSATIFTAQGNDIPGFVIITDNNNVEHSISGFIKWRTNSGNTVECFVFQPTTSVTLATNGLNGNNLYVISPNHYIGLTKNGQTLSISPIPGPVTGNSAGVLDDLNDYLTLFGNLSVADVSVNETAGTVTVTITLSASNTNTVTVAYTTSDGTATAGLDYTTTSGIITFAAGQLSRTFTIPIIDDSTNEPSETINISLSDPINASILDGFGVVTINDNDVCTITSVSVGDILIAENAGYAIFDVQGPSNSYVSLFLNNGTATGTGTDFGASNSQTTLGQTNLECSIDNGNTWTIYQKSSV